MTGQNYSAFLAPLYKEIAKHGKIVHALDVHNGITYLYLSADESTAIKLPFNVFTEDTSVISQKIYRLVQKINIESKLRTLKNFEKRHNNPNDPHYEQFFEDYEALLSIVISPFVSVSKLRKIMREYRMTEPGERIIFPTANEYGIVDLSKIKRVYEPSDLVFKKKPSHPTGAARVVALTHKIIKKAKLTEAEDEITEAARRKAASDLATVFITYKMEEAFDNLSAEHLRLLIKELEEEWEK